MARPKGSPKFGGRKKGAPNKVTATARDRITNEADPIGFWIDVANGVPVVSGEGKAAVTVVPTFEHRMHAHGVLAKKILPDLRAVEVTGEGGGKVQVEQSFDLSALTDEELLQLEAITKKLAGATNSDNPSVH